MFTNMNAIGQSRPTLPIALVSFVRRHQHAFDDAMNDPAAGIATSNRKSASHPRGERSMSSNTHGRTNMKKMPTPMPKK
jgi:hypothetical protein